MDKNFRTRIIILVIFLLGVGLFLSFIWLPIGSDQPTNGSAFKGEETLYEHDELGLSFKSLAGTQIGELENHIWIEVPTSDRLTMYFRKIQPEPELSLEEIAKIEYEAKKNQGRVSEEPQAVSFGQRQGYAFYYQIDGSYFVAHIALPLANEEVLLVSYLLQDPVGSDSQEVAERILSSLEEI